MQGDFSIMRFDPTKHFSAVMTQQGRVPLDSDVNEGVAELLHYLRTAVADILGPVAVPADGGGFGVTLSADGSGDLDISPGRMYVDGILVENDTDTSYRNQPDGYIDPDDPADELPDGGYLVYLRVWERLITAVQDPSIREVALGEYGPDTAARTKVVWQVATHLAELPSSPPPTAQDGTDWIRDNLLRLGPQLPMLTAQVPPATDDSPCDIAPDSAFRGPENQLYRVEVHTGGPAVPAESSAPKAALDTRTGATFKWSRENASVAFPIVRLSGNDVTVAARGRDDKLDLHAGDLVEIVDDRYDLRAAGDFLTLPAPMLREVVAVDYSALIITLSDDPSGSDGVTGTDPTLHPLLRRWDHGGGTNQLASDGAVAIVEDTPIQLEDGIQVTFSSSQKEPRNYRRGDYWWIPARVVTGGIIWPSDSTGPLAQPPAGVAYHYAPLAWVNGGTAQDLRHTVTPAALPASVRRRGAAKAEPKPAAGG